jgi:hypothetical protein
MTSPLDRRMNFFVSYGVWGPLTEVLRHQPLRRDQRLHRMRLRSQRWPENNILRAVDRRIARMRFVRIRNAGNAFA